MSRRYINPELIQAQATQQQAVPQVQSNVSVTPVSSSQFNRPAPTVTQHKNIIYPWGNPKLLNPLPQDGVTPLPQYFRTTVTHFPLTKSTADQCYVPLAVTINPSQVVDVPVIDYSQSVIPRCQRCRSYLSPYSQMMPNGLSWKCPFCQAVTQFQTSFTNTSSERSTEFVCPVYDMLAPSAYYAKPKAGPSFVVVADLSLEAITSGFTFQLLTSFKASLDSIDPDTYIGLITMSNVLTFYDFSRNTEFIISDLSEPCIPDSPLTLLKNCKEELIQEIDSILERIQQGAFTTNGNCLGSALELAEKAMKEFGGILILSAVGYPTFGPHAVKERTSDKELTLLKLPEDGSCKFYRDIGFRLNRASVSVHLFSLKSVNQKMNDLSIISVPCGLTGGTCYYYKQFDPTQLHNDLFVTFTSEYLWDSSMRLRCSAGVKVNYIFSNCTIRDETSYYPVMSPHNTMTYELLVESDIKSKNALFQAAALWTNAKRERRIRIFTFAIPTTNLSTVVKTTIDEAAMATYLIKRASVQVLQKGSLEASDSLRKSLNSLNSVAGANSAPNSSSFESLYHLAHSMFASKLLRQFNANPIDYVDDRFLNVIKVRAISMVNALLYLYPRMIAVDASFLSFDQSTNSLYYDETKVNNEDTDASTQPLPLDSSSFGRGFCFVVHTMEKVFIWISPSVNLNYLRAAFGVNSIEDLTSGNFNIYQLPTLQTPQSIIIQNVVNSCYMLSGRYLPVEIIPPGSPREAIFSDILVDMIPVKGSNLTAFIAEMTSSMH
ncbi:hypothetical protein M9Y10_022098 [Tritrichomonas musculus]|uniref:Sec23/Sec24 trunk domain containing protein n=1 Tax=Tritrichomonas musculus TaxID=1915356 RepID=A0ABR2KS79_9EUKA